MGKMTLPQFVGNGQIDFIEREMPEPAGGQLLIAPRANALCGSERGQYYNGSAVVPGHEAAGIVVAGGKGAKTEVGTHGVVFLMSFCGICGNCRSGATNQCLDKKADYGFTSDGGYGSFAVINENVFFPIDPSIPFAEAILLLDIMGTGGHSIKRARLLRQDYECLLVTGAGPIGLGILAMAKLILGHDFPVLISDVIPYRLSLAEKLGGLPILAGELESGIKKHGLSSVDLLIDASGKQSAKQGGMKILSQRGAMICVGHGEGLQLEVSRDLISAERAVLGSEYFCYNELAENHGLLKDNRNYLSQIITHRFGVSKIGDAFETFWRGETGKVVIEQPEHGEEK